MPPISLFSLLRADMPPFSPCSLLQTEMPPSFLFSPHWGEMPKAEGGLPTARPRQTPPNSHSMLYFLRVQGDSMSPTLRDGDRLLALSTNMLAVAPGRIVAFRRKTDLFIKRALSREADGWYVVGDNPSRSTDSRRFGVVPDSQLRTVALLRLLPTPRLLL